MHLEVPGALKKLELLLDTPRATLLSLVLSAKLSACIHNLGTQANGMNQFLKDDAS